jgi:hypothetical protein
MMLQDRLFPMPQHELTSDDYYTPSWVFERMGIEFDLDVCAPPGGIPWIPAKRYYTQAYDGLTSPWSGRVWMNPPYSQPRPWVERFIEHANGVCLVPFNNNSCTDLLLNAADAICFPGHPFTFITARKQTAHKRHGEIFWPVWLAAFGDVSVDAISRLGRVLR